MHRDIVLSIDLVEPGLINAVQLLSNELGRPLKGIVLVHKGYADAPERPIDITGFFEEIIVDFDVTNELQKTVLPFMDRILVVTTRYEDAIPHLRQVIPFVPYVNTPTESSLLWAAEKPLMRDRLKTYNAKLVPKYVCIDADNLPNWEKLTKDFTYPVIVKPGSLWSSFLVSRCDTAQELGKRLKQTFEIIEDVYYRWKRDTKPAVLVEEMMHGDMYSTDAYVSPTGIVHCLPLAKVITAASLGLPGFYGYSVIMPTQLPENEVEKGLAAAQAAIRALHLRSTTVHVELFHTKDGWKIIELGARIGGRRENLYREVYGIEHHYNDLANRAGMNPKISTEVLNHARSEDLYADEEGVLEAIEGLDEARALESMVYMHVSAELGDNTLFADKGGDVLIDAILSNLDKNKLDSDAAKLRKVVKFKIKKHSIGLALQHTIPAQATQTVNKLRVKTSA